MKIPTILTALVAVTLAAPVFAAPAHPTNGTISDDDAFFQSRLVKYNYKEMAVLAAQYDEAMSEARSLHRSNAAAKASPSKDIIPFCVGYAAKPSRIKIFRNKLTCDISGWTTLYTFTAHTKKDDYLAAKPMCVAKSKKDENRSMFFSGKTTCNGQDWATDFSFYESTHVTSFAVMWQVIRPHRMMLYPDYPATTDSEQRTFKADFVNHLEVIKRIKIESVPDAKTLRCATLLIRHIPISDIPDKRFTMPGRNLPDFAADGFDAKCTDLVAKAAIVFSRVYDNGYGSVEIQINNKTYAALSVKGGFVSFRYFFRMALLESMRSGDAVMLSKNDRFESGDGVVAYFQKTAFTMGGIKIWNAPVPSA
ncbi:hypothetical protein BGW39_000825 [Mortierella sp. 14UC]|nr:hypothetical protein BGW39_000825 [Mortierella sp. 14UC]